MAAYLYFNSVMYVIFAAWITLRPWNTALALGFETLSQSGRSEYLVVYGGLQFGLAAVFAVTAMSAQTQRLGVIIAVCLYAPIVLYRIVTVARYWPVQSTTLAVGVLEMVLLAAAVVLLARGKGV